MGYWSSAREFCPPKFNSDERPLVLEANLQHTSPEQSRTIDVSKRNLTPDNPRIRREEEASNGVPAGPCTGSSAVERGAADPDRGGRQLSSPAVRNRYLYH